MMVILNGHQQGMSAKEAWENKAVPYAHEKVDKAFSTNLQDNFDPKKDGPVEKIAQSVLLNPLSAIGGVGNVTGKAAGGLAKEVGVAG